MRSELLGEIDEVRKDELKRKKWKEKERLFLHATCESVWMVGDENGFQAMKMAFKDFLNKIIVSIWCQET